MKWFKHYSTAMDDLFINDLERKFGDSGYTFWFKTMELIASQGEGGKLKISWANYQEMLHKRRTVVEQLMDFCSTSGKLRYETVGEYVIIECKKFAEMADNYTKYDGVSTKRLQRQKEMSTKQEENRIEEEKKEKKIKEPKEPFGEFDNVFLTDAECGKLIEKLSAERFSKAVEILSAYKKSKGKEYKSDYATFFTWVIKELEKREKDGSTGKDSRRYHFDKSKYPTLNKENT